MSVSQNQRRVVIISTTFFPDPQVSAIRMTHWCRHLPEHGWQPHVLCRYYGYEATPEEIASAVHPAVIVDYLDRPESPTGRQQKIGFIPTVRGSARSASPHRLLPSICVPDLSIWFWRRNPKAILQRILAIQPEIIITSSSPHSNHDIGLLLTAQTCIPWIADFRDPYLIDNRFQPRGMGLRRRRAHRRFK